ncbi:TPA: hypothetical protein ACQRQI_005765, partial [Pseudomonas aeruginosa]
RLGRPAQLYVETRHGQFEAGLVEAPTQAQVERPHDCDDIRDGDTRRQCRAIVRGDRKRCDDIDSRDMRRQCRAVVSRAPWQCDGIDDRDMRRICRVILSR